MICQITSEILLKPSKGLSPDNFPNYCSGQCMKIPVSCQKLKKKKTRERDMLIGTSRMESFISLLLLVVVLCGYQIYQFPTGLRFILSLNSVCKGIKLYFT